MHWFLSLGRWGYGSNSPPFIGGGVDRDVVVARGRAVAEVVVVAAEGLENSAAVVPRAGVNSPVAASRAVENSRRIWDDLGVVLRAARRWVRLGDVVEDGRVAAAVAVP